MTLKRKIITTADGSSSIHIEDWDEQYHSKHGALQEANHVFIKNGLNEILKTTNDINILEFGFGTGLNCFLTLIETNRITSNIIYTGIEKHPINQKEWNNLNYINQIENASLHKKEYDLLFKSKWEIKNKINDNFYLKKNEIDFFKIPYNEKYNLIYFDAFGFRVQPKLWSQEMFDHIYKLTAKDGILVTYAAKGSVRRAMIEAGFSVERLPGPPGKREMLRASKKQ